MPGLQKQVIPVPFQGLETKLDPKVAPIGTFQVVENFVMTQYPKLQKRDGVTQLGVDTAPSNITTTYNYNNEIGVMTTEGLYSYSPSLDQFQDKGQCISPVVTSYPVIANTYTQTNCDISVSTNSIQGNIWEDSRGGIWCTIIDIVSDTFLVSSLQLSETGTKPKTIALGNQILFLWCESGTTSLFIQQYNTLTNSFYDAVLVTDSLASCETYDVAILVNCVLIVVAQTDAAPDVLWGYYYTTFRQEIGQRLNGNAPPQSLGFTQSGTLPSAISIAPDPNNIYFSLTVYNDSNEVWQQTFYNYFAPMASITEITQAPTTDPGWTVSTCLDTNNNLYVFYTSYDTGWNTFNAILGSVTTTPALIDTYTTSFQQKFIMQLGVVSKSFFFNGNAYVILAYTSESGLQNTYFGLRDDGVIFARLFAQVGGGNFSKANCITSFITTPTQQDTYLANLLQTTEVISSQNSYFSVTSVFTEQIYFTPSDIDNSLSSNLLNISGGFLKQYDGSPTVFEQGYHLYPEKPTLTQATSGNLTLLGTYSYIVCWEWRDNYGQIHRSETSLPATVTLTGSNNSVVVTVPPLPLTARQNHFSFDRSPVIMAVYRTENLGTVYYRVNQLPVDFVYVDTLATTLSFTDTLSDTDLRSNSTLYTTGGIFDNIATPSANLMAVCKQVVVLAGVDTNYNQVFYSKPIQPGLGVEFSNELSFFVDNLGGRITALAAMDDKVLIFKKTLVYYVAGPFPDALGNGSAPYPLLVASDCGCANPQSIVLTGLGIMFQSPKGIYLIDRQLNVSYIGQAVDALTNPPSGPITITSAINLPDQNRVYFTDAVNNQVLVYDTFFQKWYTFSYRFSPYSSTSLFNSVYLSSTSGLYQSIVNQPNDGPYAIESTLKSDWISLAQLEGFQRIYNILITGGGASNYHTLNVNIYYDFNETPAQTLTITPTKLFTGTWGDETTWGSGWRWGNSPNGPLYDGTYQFMVSPKIQKCTAIMIEIYDTFPDGNRSVSFSLSNISLVVGIKYGYNKNLSYIRRLT